MNASDSFIAARDEILRMPRQLRSTAQDFRWPRLGSFNWACDYFDRLAMHAHPALRVVDDAGADFSLSFGALAARSSQVANFLRGAGVARGDRVLVMLGNVVPLWETMLGIMKLGAVVIPSATLLSSADLADRLQRGEVRAIVTDGTLTTRFAGLAGAPVRISVGACPVGWLDYSAVGQQAQALAHPPDTSASDPFLLYFTSGTTARPKLVLHTQASYPVGHLSTLHWLGLKPGDVHLNLSSPGWAKHAWSSFFAPWNAAATVLAYHYERFHAPRLLDQLVRTGVTTFCAPPTVWRMLVQEDLQRWPVTLREVTSAGEPLNPEVIEQVEAAWGLVIRDGFGQTETTAVIGNPPGELVKHGSMGRPLPGYRVVLVAPDGTLAEEGEICLDLADRPLGLMDGYLDDPDQTRAVMHGGYYHTGDVASRDADGYFTYVGRMDDVFKSSDYRISPFELESVLIEHPAVAEAAVVPSPDALRLFVPKAFIVLASGQIPDAAMARAILAHASRRLAPFKRIRRLEFAALPKTISGKIRRIELRQAEERRGAHERRPGEFWEEDLKIHAGAPP
jgi:acetyl-CoA synthetase